MVRETILDAAERFLRSETADDLTLRGLAQEAGVSLAQIGAGSPADIDLAMKLARNGLPIHQAD